MSETEKIYVKYYMNYVYVFSKNIFRLNSIK